MSSSESYFLLVISNREALGWILSEQRMAFAPSRYHLIDSLRTGDRLVVYTTRTIFGNPPRDRGRIIGTATTTSPVQTLDTPVTFGDRTFNRGCSLQFQRLAPIGSGPELAGLVKRLHTFPAHWYTHIRRTLVPLDKQDFMTLDEAISGVDSGWEAALPTYMAQVHRAGRRAASSA
jgi:hypothetical protein